MYKTVTGFSKVLGTCVIALVLGAAFVTSASAQQICAKRAVVVEGLGAKYKERTTSVGLVSNGMVIEVLTSNTGTWTILMTATNGVSCIMAAGESWEAVDKVRLGGPAA